MLEAVPNVSEGRDASAIDAIGRAFSACSALLDVHSDPDHHRTVLTLVGDAEGLVESLLAGTARALELIDLRQHDGVHPRVGAVDVVPLVPLDPLDLRAAAGAADEVARRIGADLDVPVLLYGELAEGRRPAFYRRGGLDELARRIASGEVQVAAGPARVDARTGVVLVGARRPLVAYNVELETEEVSVAQGIAAAVRETGGGMQGVQAIGLELPRSRRIQVSMNVLDLDRSPLHEVVACVAREAAARGVAVRGGELVGLVPDRVLAAAREAGIDLPGVDESRVLERMLGL